MSLQDIKDTFYSRLRDRLSANSPGRTIVLRGTTRPALLVTENELSSTAEPVDAFTLSWTALDVDPLGLAKCTCQIHYATAGTTGAAGMDRGRTLAAMDAELRAALTTCPQSAPLVSFAEIDGGGASTQTTATSNIFWSDPIFAACAPENERLARTTTVEVFGYV